MEVVHGFSKNTFLDPDDLERQPHKNRRFLPYSKAREKLHLRDVYASGGDSLHVAPPKRATLVYHGPWASLKLGTGTTTPTKTAATTAAVGTSTTTTTETTTTTPTLDWLRRRGWSVGKCPFNHFCTLFALKWRALVQFGLI